MVYKLRRDFKEWPYWKKGTMFMFENDTAVVWGMVDKNTTNGYPMRSFLAGYLWSLITEKGLFTKVKYGGNQWSYASK